MARTGQCCLSSVARSTLVQKQDRPHPPRGTRPISSQIWNRSSLSRSERADVLRLRTLRALGDVELDLLVLVQRLVAVGLDGRVVHEDVVAAVLLRNEAETLLGVEPLHGALSHVLGTPVIGTRSHHIDGSASSAVTRRSDLQAGKARRGERRWITNSAGVNLLELAPVAGATLPTKRPTSPVADHLWVN